MVVFGCFLGLFGLTRRRMCLRELPERGFFVPSPPHHELLVHVSDAPAGLFVDFFENLQDLFLLFAVREDFGSVSKGADGDGSDATGN